MPIFEHHFYRLGQDHFLNVEGYRTALIAALANCASDSERDLVLRAEAIEITRHVTDGIRDLITNNRRIRHLVLNQGAVPLATWSNVLDEMAKHPMPIMRKQIDKMRTDLENGRIEGFPGTMEINLKPTFATLDGFYKVIFALADANSNLQDLR